jgi:hypothetical protein
VDQNHNVWGNLWAADRLAKYDPSKGEWTMFDLPIRGTEIRHISLLERDGVTKVIVPIYRDGIMGVMTLRSEADIAALRATAGADTTGSPCGRNEPARRSNRNCRRGS